VIGFVGFAGEGDVNDVLCGVLVEGGEDQGEKRVASGFLRSLPEVGCLRRGGGAARKTMSGENVVLRS